MHKTINSESQHGKLYIVATPIGNHLDISQRAVNILKEVDFICAEDTRRSGQLLQAYAVKTKMRSFHDHNEAKIAPELIQLLSEGKKIALISDAGTPLINDPGFNLVQLANQQQIPVIPLPGPCAAITALSVAGIASDRFCYEGFLTSKSTARKKQLQQYLHEKRTLIFYEAPHRIVATLEDMSEVFGPEHLVTIARELTKTYETIKSDQLSNILLWIKSDSNQQKGEFVIVVAGFTPVEKSSVISSESERVLQLLLTELSLKQAVQLAVKLTEEKKKPLYQRALEIMAEKNNE